MKYKIFRSNKTVQITREEDRLNIEFSEGTNVNLNNYVKISQFTLNQSEQINLIQFVRKKIIEIRGYRSEGNTKKSWGLFRNETNVQITTTVNSKTLALTLNDDDLAWIALIALKHVSCLTGVSDLSTMRIIEGL